MICVSMFHWISDWCWSHFWCFFNTFSIRTYNLLNHQKHLYFQWISMILLFRETLFLMIFLIFSVTSFSIYFFRQKDAKMDPKSDQHWTTNHKKTDVWDLWAFWDTKTRGSLRGGATILAAQSHHVWSGKRLNSSFRNEFVSACGVPIPV